MDTVYQALINALAADFCALVDWRDATRGDKVIAVNRWVDRLIDHIREHGPPSKEQEAQIVKLFSIEGIPQTGAIGQIMLAIAVERKKRDGSYGEFADAEPISDAARILLSGVRRAAEIGEWQPRDGTASRSPTLLDVHVEILMCLYEAGGVMIQVEIMLKVNGGRHKIGKALKFLREHDLVTRPFGDRQGEAITSRGEAYLKSRGLARTKRT